MTDHRTGTRAEWLAARLELLNAEKEFGRVVSKLKTTIENPFGKRLLK